jgi:3-hydroxyacyl-CoA dehydrogenase
MANEAVRCLAEGVAASEQDVDLATVFGMGFPAFRGGLCRWMETEGRAALRSRLEDLAGRLGPRFVPAVGW